ncbi:MAG: hypothetical protein JXR70_14745 [Spirochaetales bacterium]|nr:hypothetical protein [Spirochaetales bacterium]
MQKTNLESALWQKLPLKTKQLPHSIVTAKYSIFPLLYQAGVFQTIVSRADYVSSNRSDCINPDIDKKPRQNKSGKSFSKK